MSSSAVSPRLPVTVRLAVPRELPLLGEVEQRASARFVAIGLAELTRSPNVPPALLARQQAAGLVWVAGEPPQGFAVALEHPAALHVHELDVVPEAAGRGLGRALLDAVAAEAARRGLPALTLITFRDVPWNAPHYRRLGFVEAPEAGRRPEVAALLEEERRCGLAALGVRVVMARPAGPAY